MQAVMDSQVLDSQLSFKAHIASVIQSCSFTFYNICKIRPFLTQESAQLGAAHHSDMLPFRQWRLIPSGISKLDYCNSLLTGLPACALKPLQLIQNVLVFNQTKFSHVSPLLRSLHRLPVVARTEYKTLMLTFKAAKGMAPPYLQNLINPYNPTRSLRSANTGMLKEPSLKTPGQKSTRPRQFALQAPKLWNKLPVALRTTDSLTSFRRGLKTYLFSLHLNP